MPYKVFHHKISFYAYIYILFKSVFKYLYALFEARLLHLEIINSQIVNTFNSLLFTVHYIIFSIPLSNLLNHTFNDFDHNWVNHLLLETSNK